MGYIYIWVTVGFSHMYGHVVDYKPLLNILNGMLRIHIFRGMWDAHRRIFCSINWGTTTVFFVPSQKTENMQTFQPSKLCQGLNQKNTVPNIVQHVVLRQQAPTGKPSKQMFLNCAANENHANDMVFQAQRPGGSSLN